MLASSSQAISSSEFIFVSFPKIGDAPPNTHIFWLEPSETHRGYGCHAFHPTGRRILDKQAVPVIYHQGTWYTLRHKAGTSFPISELNAPIYRCTTYNPKHNLLSPSLKPPNRRSRLRIH